MRSAACTAAVLVACLARPAGAQAPEPGDGRWVQVFVEVAEPVVRDGYAAPRALRTRVDRAAGSLEVHVAHPDGTWTSSRTSAEGAVFIPDAWLGSRLVVLARTPAKAAMWVDDCPFTNCADGRNLWAAGTVVDEHLVAEGAWRIPAESPAAGAMAILLAAQRAAGFVADAGHITRSPLGFRWLPGSSTSCGTTCFVASAEPHIPVLGLDSDSDHFDAQIVMHEFGHFVEFQLAGASGPGGYHDGTPTTPALAFSEGFATWFAVAASGEPVYVDSHRDGVAWYNYAGRTARADETAGITQPLSEDLVVELLLGVSPAGDPTAAAAVLDAVALAARNGGWCGAPGVDLADVLRALAETAPVPAVALADAALAHGFPWEVDDCSEPAPAIPRKPDVESPRSPITPASVAVSCDRDGDRILVQASARADWIHSTVAVRRVSPDGTVAEAAVHDLGPVSAGDGWNVALRGDWTRGLVAARLDWTLRGGSRGATVATSSCDLPDPGDWAWLDASVERLADGTTVRVSDLSASR